jgi:hypothetical protein
MCCILLAALYPYFIAANGDPNQKLTKVRSLLYQLPKRNFATFHMMARHLSLVASMESVNMVRHVFHSLLIGVQPLYPSCPVTVSSEVIDVSVTFSVPGVLNLICGLL